MFFSSKTFDLFLKHRESISSSVLDSFRYNVQKNKGIVKTKYLRKFNFTQMIQAGIDMETLNFIQGRTSKNIGFNHYLAKKEIAINGYIRCYQFILT